MNNAYDLVKITEPVGTAEYRKRNSAYQDIDNTQCIFVDTVGGSDLNSGENRNEAVETISEGISKATSDRPYVIVMKPVDGTKITLVGDLTINKSFTVYLIAEYIVEVTGTLFVEGPCYVEGFEVGTIVRIRVNHPKATFKYCDLDEIRTPTSQNLINGLDVEVYNTIMRDKGIWVQNGPGGNITGDINVIFDHVYLANTASTVFLNFEPTSYDTSATNNFVFNNVTNNQSASGTIIECGSSTAITISFNKSLLAADTATRLNSEASVAFNESVTYSIINTGAGSVVSNDCQIVTAGDIDVVTATGAPESIARGFAADSLALNYVGREEDAGAFLEVRIPNALEDNEEHLRRESFLVMDPVRAEYRYDLMSDKFSFYLRFKPLGNFQETGVLFDSRYSGDFDSGAGLFNQNANDFLQIVYGNKTYQRNELTADKYCFKFIISNGSQTNVAVAGPYFTNDENSEYDLWHEIGVMMFYADTYNPKYESADITTNDKDRKQMIIATMFDRELDRVYALKNEPFEDTGGNEIPTSLWFENTVVSRFFNIGTGWTASWISTPSGAEWSTWAESSYSMIVDDFMVSSDIVPLNILKDFGELEKIDLLENDFRIGRYDDKNAGIIVHCDNPHPFSENGLQPEETLYASFRQYEGFESHAIAIESYSPNFLAQGRIKSGDWFDRSEARVWDDTTNWITWGAANGLSDSEVAILAESTGGNLYLKFVDSQDGTVTDTATIITGASISQAILGLVGSTYIVAYIPGDSKAYFKTVDSISHTVSSAYTINNATSAYLSMCGGHSSSQVAFAYRHSDTYGYIHVMDTSGSTIDGPTQVSNSEVTEYNTIAESNDIDGNASFTFFYKNGTSSDLKFVMYLADLSATVFAHDTLVTGEDPRGLQSAVFQDGKIFVKWQDYTAASDSPVNGALIDQEGTEVVTPATIYATGAPETSSSDFLLTPELRLVFALRDNSTDNVIFKVYEEDGTEVDNSPYLRDFDDDTVESVHLAHTQAGNAALATVINDGSFDAGNIIELQEEVPSRWYQDFTGSFDAFHSEAHKTKTLFGWAYHQRFNHASSTGQGQIWQPVTITSAGDSHFLTCYYWILSGKWVLKLDGAALNNDIEFTFEDDELSPYTHDSVNLDSVDFVKDVPVNFNRIRKFSIRFTPDSAGTLNVRLMSEDSSDDDQVDEFYIDNIKVEEGDHGTSIDATSNGVIEYPYSVKREGSAFFRIIPEFFIGAAEHDHTIFSAYATDESGTEYITHELYYDETDGKFKFYITDVDGTTAEVESDEYGVASVSRKLTDLRERHTIICNWNIDDDYIELVVDNDLYGNYSLGLGDFAESENALIGNRDDGTTAADALFDLIRIGEEPLGVRQIAEFANKRDPFIHRSKTDIGAVNVKSLSFFGITSYDQFEKTIYTEKVGDAWALIIDKGENFGNTVVVRRDSVDIMTISSTGVTIDGSLSVSTLVAQTTATIDSTSDHITLRFGFSGTPPVTNDGYLEIERGSLVNSEVRWDESQDAWLFHNGTANQVSIDNRSIGTWGANNTFHISANGTGNIRLNTGTSTDGGGGDGTTLRDLGTERFTVKPTETVVNEPGLGYDFRVESDGRAWMLFVDASEDLVTVSRASGAIPALTGGFAPRLAVDRTIAAIWHDDTSYGVDEFVNNSGEVGGYIGKGNPGATPSYWQIHTDQADELRISGQDMVLSAGLGIKWTNDRTNSRFFYTADATSRTGSGTSPHGVEFAGSITAYKVYQSVWNDYAEAFEFDKEIESDPQPGFVYKMTENGIIKTEERADSATVGVYSDTYGQLMGSAGILDKDHPDGYKLPIGLTGKIKVWVKEEVEIGAPLVSDAGGFATVATSEERSSTPDLIIGKALEASKDNSEKRIWALIK
jgi:hypothetical protein